MAEWRPAVASDAAAIANLARAELGDYGEAAELYAERITLAPTGCWVLIHDAARPTGRYQTSSRQRLGIPDNETAPETPPILGHCISHPWRRFVPPAMHALLGAIPSNPECWYLHDVVVAPAGRGMKAVERLLPILATTAATHDIATLALIAVGGADAYWARQGFVIARGSAAGFGKDAMYMERAT